MRIFLTGGSGFIGRFLTFALAEQGHEITVLSRNLKKPFPFSPRVFILEADPTKTGAWQKIAGDHDAIINLAGLLPLQVWSNFILIILIWCSTAFLQVPRHYRLTRGFDLKGINFLV
ncbi:MAG: NAD(P)-dependent oxidoreductase [Thermodesulfobacteriota bacterium]|jgi:nucleoside-diphosphate-sugar epimerase|nr:MAG: NAD(P)-dependent oxidoreductase [Thermodesulfobacteriota bacterium]